MTPLFVELCAGTAALSLRLQGGNRCRPVVGRIGAKTGYANVILSCFGLVPGGKAAAYLWCEPDPGARLLLQALPQPEVLREAASVLRGWADRNPRELWEELRKEGAPKGCEGRGVARCLLVGAWSWRAGVPDSGFRDPFGGCSGSAQGADAGTDGLTVPGMAWRLSMVPDLRTVHITDDARLIAPREVARYLLTGVWSYQQGNPKTGFVGPGERRQDTTATATATATERIADLGEGVNACIVDSAIEPRAMLPEGTVCFIDPPYLNTTGYGADLPRSEVVRLARLWADAGAFVGVSEQTPIPELVADGWHTVRITNGRKGAARTFSKQKDEWLTLSRPPVNPPILGAQESLL